MIRQLFIAILVVLHFTLGLLTFLPSPSVPRSLPVLGEAIALYELLDLQQTWKMFSPPAQDISEVGVSFKFKDGWTPLQAVNESLREQVQGKWLEPLPRGFIRLSNHFRPPQQMQSSLDQEPAIKFYYRELSTYFCSGQGRVEGLKTVRFYLVTRGIEPFFPTDEQGKPVPGAAERSSTRALYERDCT